MAKSQGIKFFKQKKLEQKTINVHVSAQRNKPFKVELKNRYKLTRYG